MSGIVRNLSRTLLIMSKVKHANKLRLQPCRDGHTFNYRTSEPKYTKAVKIGADIIGTATWWWILWHLWHEYEHITGEFEYPDTSAWSNKHLGIPKEA